MNSKKKNFLIFAILFLITNLIFLPWLVKGHMSTDSYKIFDMGYQEYNKHFFLLDGRFMSAGLTYLMDIFHVPIAIYSSISLEIAILVSCLSVMILVNTVKKWKTPKNLWNEIVLIFASYYTIFHFLYIENLHFVECGSMVLSILLFILAARQIVEKNRFWALKAFVQLCIGMMCYQGTISMFVLALLLFSICKGISIKQMVKNFLQGILLTLGGVLVNHLAIKVVEQIYELKQTRGINFSILENNIIFIWNNIINALKYTGHLIPENSYLIVLCSTEVLMILKIWQQNREKQDTKNANIILEQFAIICIGIGAGFIVSVINLPGFWAGRSRFSIGALIGFLWIHLWMKTNFSYKKEWLNIVLVIYLFLYGLMSSMHYVTAIIDHQKLNELDKETVITIQEYVTKYEEKTETKVDKIAVIVKRNKTLRAFYPNLRSYGNVMMSRGIKTQWAISGCYYYYTDKKLEEYIPNAEEQQEYLKQNKEYLCIGDTLYITAYMY